MAMNGNTLGTAIKNAINALTAEQKQDVEVIWQTIASEITSHIAGNAVVSVTSVSGVTAGEDNSGSGSGSIS